MYNEILSDIYALIMEIQQQVNGNCRVSFMATEHFLQIGVTWPEGLAFKEKIDLIDIEQLHTPKKVLVGLFATRANRAYADYISKKEIISHE